MTMPSDEARLWWPFPVPPPGKRSAEVEAKVTFLEAADSRGFRAYVDRDDCGAIAADGRECLIVWRGRQRAELILIDAGAVQSRRMFVDGSEAEAFHQASAEALERLTSRPTSMYAARFEGEVSNP